MCCSSRSYCQSPPCKKVGEVPIERRRKDESAEKPPKTEFRQWNPRGLPKSYAMRGGRSMSSEDSFDMDGDDTWDQGLPKSYAMRCMRF